MGGHSETGDEAYRLACESGLVGKRNLQILNTIITNPDITGGEAADILGKPRETTSPAFAVLRDMGLIEETGTRVFSPTGCRQKTWRATGNTPIKNAKNRETLPKMVARLRSELAEARSENNNLRITISSLNRELEALVGVDQ